jgi:hypothetical protein
MMRALQSATMARQCRFEPLLSVLSQTRQCAALVPPHEAEIAYYFGCDDCRKSTLLAEDFPGLLTSIIEGLTGWHGA